MDDTSLDDTSGASISEGGYIARLVNRADAREVEACERLRYEEFVVKRAWVAADPLCLGRERDGYDAEALHLTVFEGERVAAYLRVLEGGCRCGFMLHREFAALLCDSERKALQRENTVEVSRLAIASNVAVAPGVQNGSASRCSGKVVTELLLKLLYRLALERGWNRFYLVAEAGWPKVFARRFGLVFEPVGQPCTFPDGTVTVAALTTLAVVEESVTKHSPEKAHWYQNA